MKEEVLKHPLHLIPNKNRNSVGYDKDVFTQILSLNESSIILRVWAWTHSENDAIRMEGDLLKNFKSRFDAAVIEIPFPQHCKYSLCILSL